LLAVDRAVGMEPFMQLGVVKELTEIVVAAAGDPSLADRI
jgi:hypothetical protein